MGNNVGIPKCLVCSDKDKLNSEWCNVDCVFRNNLKQEIKKNRARSKRQKIVNYISSLFL